MAYIFVVLQVLSQFIGNHPQSKKSKIYTDFFSNQLEYEYEDGRISAIEMLNILFETLPQVFSMNYFALFFQFFF